MYDGMPCYAFIADGHADALLAELLPLAGRHADAVAADNEALAVARQGDCDELLDGLYTHKLRALVLIQAAKLDRLGWRPDVPAAGVGRGEPPVLEWEGGQP